jgi:hypothetical protein
MTALGRRLGGERGHRPQKEPNREKVHAKRDLECPIHQSPFWSCRFASSDTFGLFPLLQDKITSQHPDPSGEALSGVVKGSVDALIRKIKPRALLAAKIMALPEDGVALGKITAALGVKDHRLRPGRSGPAARSATPAPREKEQPEQKKKQEEEQQGI